MVILSDFFIADPSSVSDYASAEAVEAEDKCQLKGITPLQAAQMLAVLRGQDYSMELIGEFPLLTPEDAEDWTMSVPSDMVDSLAAITPGDIADLARRFADATSAELG